MPGRKAPSSCRRCGECCRRGGPALHQGDLPLFRKKGGLDLADLVTLRRGEPVFDQIKGRALPLDREMVKIRPAPGSRTCIFYRDNPPGCSAYENRPMECRALLCSDTSALEQAYATPRLTRADLIPAGHPLLELMTEHDVRCASGRLAGLLQGPSSAAVRGEIEAMLEYDRSLRLLVAEKSGIDPQALDFLFGRPLHSILDELAASPRSIP